MPHLQPSISQKEHNPNLSAKRVLNIDPFGGIVTEGNFTTKIDESDTTMTYIGNAQLGTSVSSARWQIKKITISGNVTTIAWADGVDSFTKVWDDRATYTFS